MDSNYISTVFFTLFVIVDPLGSIPIFISYLSGYDEGKRRIIILKTIVTASGISIIFILFGKIFLDFLGITPASFIIAGGILLFMISMEMLFAGPSRTKLAKDDVPLEDSDISVFPLAIPLLCGPGNIAALLMFSAQADSNIYMLMTVLVISILIFIIASVVMFFSVYIETFLGSTGVSVLQRITGLVLSAMSVQFIINGLKQIDFLPKV